MRFVNRFTLAIFTGCMALSLAGCPQKQPVAAAPPPPPPSGGKTLIVSRGISAVHLLHFEAPQYPALARAAHIQGPVVLRAIISKEGKIINLEVVSSPSQLLTQSALDAVRMWTYSPYLLNGEPTEVDTRITVNFTGGSKPSPR